MFLKEPLIEIKRRTKTTPIVTREAVSSVLLLYLRRFLKAILNRLPIFLSSFGLLSNQFSILQTVYNLRFAHDLLVVGGEDEGSPKLIPHLFHRLKDQKCSLMIEICGWLIGQDQFWIGDQRSCNSHPLFLPTGDLIGVFVLLVNHPNGFQHGQNSLSPFSSWNVLDHEKGILDIFINRKDGDKVEILEYEPDVVSPE